MIHLPRPVPDNNPAEIQAFDAVCERLAGFDDRLSAEFIDGWLTALAALPLPHPREVWLPALTGDTFERVFADPADAAQAQQALEARLKVLRAQLDPDALMDRPDDLRLSPLMAEWTAADREEAQRSAGMSADDAAMLVTGGMWADGFTAALEALPEVKLQVDDEDDAADQQRLLAHVAVLTLPEGRPELAEHIATHYTEAADGAPLARDALLDSACFAIQDLRLWWLDHLPRPETRRVQPTPGRNDPCPCGSGQKYKKCHGALA